MCRHAVQMVRYLQQVLGIRRCKRAGLSIGRKARNINGLRTEVNLIGSAGLTYVVWTVGHVLHIRRSKSR